MAIMPGTGKVTRAGAGPRLGNGARRHTVMVGNLERLEVCNITEKIVQHLEWFVIPLELTLECAYIFF